MVRFTTLDLVHLLHLRIQGRSQWGGLRGLGPPYEKVVYFFLLLSLLCVKYE